MTQLEVIYQPDGAGNALTLDSTALLDRFRTIVGEELGADWHVAAAVRMENSSWLVTLEHDAADSAAAVQDRLVTPADPAIRLCLDGKPTQAAGPVLASLSLPLPVEVPRVLTRPEAIERKRVAVQGIATGLIISIVLGLMTPMHSAIRRMFEPTTPTAAVPISILCLFFWGWLYGMNRRRRLNALESLTSPDLLPAVIHGLRTQGVERLEQALRGQSDEYTVVRHSPLLRRIWITLEQWLIRPSLQNAHLALEQQVISDREGTQRAFNLLRIFVWATPVLGLIGTVVGISMAVGGFAGFLSTSVDDVSKIKAGLVGVTGGLSFAFLITLEGLLVSLILMLFTSNIQTREERLYASIEKDVAERFLPELQRISPERDSDRYVPGADIWSNALSDAARRVIKAIDLASRKIATKWEEKHEVYVSDLHSAHESVRLSAQTVASAFGATVAAQQSNADAVGDLARVTAQVLEAQTALQAAMLQLRAAELAKTKTE